MLLFELFKQGELKSYFVNVKKRSEKDAFSMFKRKVLQVVLVAGENRSCKEHKPKYKGVLPNCATCRRYIWKTGKCREMIWVKQWVGDEYAEGMVFHAFDHMMRSNRGLSGPM